MIEAMACGTPVIALPGGAVEEVVQDGVSGYVCRSTDDMVRCAKDIVGNLSPSNVRQYCQQYFSVERMVADYVALYQRIAAEDNPLAQVNGSDHDGSLGGLSLQA